MFRSTMESLIGIGIVVLVLSWLALWTSPQNRRAFFWGLLAALIAYVIQIVVPFPILFFGIHLPPLLAVMFAPFIEESVRITTAALSPVFAGQRIWQAGLWYAIGYASVEATAKLFDAVALASRSNFAPWISVVAQISIPPVVFLLHLTLGLVAACLFAARWRPLLVLPVTFAIHFAHNASVYWGVFVSSYTTLILLACIRMAVFVFVISHCMSFLRGADERYKALQ